MILNDNTNNLSIIEAVQLLLVGLVFILGIFIIAGCDKETRKELFPSSSEKVNSILYYKDSRTNLCFTSSVVHNQATISDEIFMYVPCTPEVERLIVK